MMTNVGRFLSCSVLLFVCFVVQWFIFFFVVERHLRHHNVCMSQDEFQALTETRRNKEANYFQEGIPSPHKEDWWIVSESAKGPRDSNTKQAFYFSKYEGSKTLVGSDVSHESNDHPATIEPLDGSNDESLRFTSKQKSFQDTSQKSEFISENSRTVKHGCPPLAYEKTRRRLHTGVDDLWSFMTSEIRKLCNKIKTPERIKVSLSKILEKGAEFKRSLLLDVEKLSEVDGYGKWRENEEAVLTHLVQTRLHSLQNPVDCQSARKLVCSRPNCGFGCRIHHLVHCLIMAYGTQRTMIMSMQGWGQPGVGFEYLFLPLSTTCTLYSPVDDTALPKWTGNNSIPVVLVPSLQNLTDPRQRRFCNPPSVPRDLVDSITKFHGLPIAWWVGQMLKYLTRLQPRIESMINGTAIFPIFKHPIVGVHIRRSDKVGYEAAYHPVEEYMYHVEEYFARLSLSHQSIIQKRIFLASDDTEVFKEIQGKYPYYEIVGNPETARWAGDRRLREHSKRSLHDTVTDLYFLASSDFLVCTFSSQFCRNAYELMQAMASNAVHRFRSLDDSYYFGGQGVHTAVAIFNHNASTRREMDLSVGDVVELKGNLWNGYTFGRNLRTNVTGTFPYFKVQEAIESEDCPTYEQLPLKQYSRKKLDESD